MISIVWTPVALKSLRETISFLNLKWNTQTVDTFINLLDERIQLLMSNPELAPKIGKSEIRKLLIHPTISLYYKLNQDFLMILLIWDNRQNPDDLHGKLLG